jgi:Zn-dependent metalloprotease
MITTRTNLAVAALVIGSLVAVPAADAWQRPAKVALATKHLRDARVRLGLGSEADFVARHELPTSDGRTIVRFQQTHLGHRIWGAEAIAHVDKDGNVSLVDRTVTRGVTVAGTPRLTADEATRIALLDLHPQGGLAATPVVEQVVFPTRHTRGLATTLDPKTKRMVIDRALSTFAKPPSDPYVWAFEVKTFVYNAVDGHSEMAYVIDATTGAILRKWDEQWFDQPAQGTGHSFYRGQVDLSTTQASDGTFSLLSKERGNLPQPVLAAMGITQIGLATYYGAIDLLHGGGRTVRPYAGHAADDWGSGQLPPVAYASGVTLLDTDKSFSWLSGAATPDGETYAVDAHWGLSRTWDFYHDVFQRNGIDNQGTSTLAIVHFINGSSTNGWIPMIDNASWSPGLFGMEFGEGTYPQIPTGFSSTTELDITGHELTHGVAGAEVGFLNGGMSGGLSEANSDIFGKMVQAWVEGGATGSTIPDFAAGDLTRWDMGLNSRPAGPIRYMYQPSLDGYSPDAWYQGVENLEIHAEAGPVNRFFYFLSQGASADPNSPTHSVYLPAGMTGIGNDHAARIWYKTLTEYLTPDADYDVARDGSVRAAGDLYGIGSPEQAAVYNAWAAVNVGVPPGTPEPVRVSFPVVHAPDSFVGEELPSGMLRRVQLFPTRARVQIQCDVSNTTDHRVDFTIGTLTAGYMAGVVNDDGTWTTPSFAYYADPIPVQCTSKADPRQFARGQMMLLALDSDNDGETDALDLGNVAMLWGLMTIPDINACVACLLGTGPLITDWDVDFFNEAFLNAWAAPRQ